MWKSFVSELRGEWFEFVCDLLIRFIPQPRWILEAGPRGSVFTLGRALGRFTLPEALSKSHHSGGERRINRRRLHRRVH
jgi:hypothetical protein